MQKPCARAGAVPQLVTPGGPFARRGAQGEGGGHLQGHNACMATCCSWFGGRLLPQRGAMRDVSTLQNALERALTGPISVC